MPDFCRYLIVSQIINCLLSRRPAAIIVIFHEFFEFVLCLARAKDQDWFRVFYWLKHIFIKTADMFGKFRFLFVVRYDLGRFKMFIGLDAVYAAALFLDIWLYPPDFFAFIRQSNNNSFPVVDPAENFRLGQ